MERKLGKIAIVLAVLLGVSLFALGCTLTYDRLSDSSVVVSVENNRITAETAAAGGAAPAVLRAPVRDISTHDPTPMPAPTPTAKADAITIELYNKQTEDNTPFQVSNMFPGDSVTKNFRVRVSYHDSVTVHFKATVRDGYEKLAEVMMVRVKLTTTGETLYDGLMRDMPKSLTHKLSSTKSTTDELDYEITAYLDTSVGNDYQKKDLVADFSWWVDKEDTKKLEPPPKTGDSADMLLWTCLALASGGVICLLFKARKRKEGENV